MKEMRRKRKRRTTRTTTKNNYSLKLRLVVNGQNPFVNQMPLPSPIFASYTHVVNSVLVPVMIMM